VQHIPGTPVTNAELLELTAIECEIIDGVEHVRLRFRPDGTPYDFPWYDLVAMTGTAFDAFMVKCREIEAARKCR
jgi:hypothetical protein